MKTSAKLAGRLRRAKKRSFDGDHRAAETRELMRKARVDDEVEVMDLQASELACDVADAWAAELARVKKTLPHDNDAEDVLRDRDPIMFERLKRLELVTRPSAMRKVRP
jgi:hypothetical protein